MNLKELITITDKLFYKDSSSYQVIKSKQKELLEHISGATNIKQITVDKINKYIEFMKQHNNSNNTINSKLRYLNRILNYAYRNQWLDYKPYIPSFKITESKDLFLTDDEINMMLNWSKNKCNVLYLTIVIGLNTGLRISDILNIINNIKTINIENNYIHLKIKKTCNNISIPLNDKMLALISSDSWREYSINYQQIQYLFKKMKQELQLNKKITIHTLRHTFCSRLVQKDVPIAIIQKLAGHKKITTTMKYAHIKNEQLEKAIQVL